MQSALGAESSPKDFQRPLHDAAGVDFGDLRWKRDLQKGTLVLVCKMKACRTAVSIAA
jgi:hypothetical protein